MIISGLSVIISSVMVNICESVMAVSVFISASNRIGRGTDSTSADRRPIDSVTVVVTVTVGFNKVDEVMEVVDLMPRPSLFLKFV